MTEIRAARPADAAAIAAVHVASWRVAYRDLLPAEVLAGLSVGARERTWASILLDPPPWTAVLVAVVDERVAGFVSIGPNRDGEPLTGELYAIYLHPDRWRRGLGTRLHAAAITRLADLGFADATLWVLDGNERAIAFYRRSGWTGDGHRRTDTEPGGVPLPEQRWRRPTNRKRIAPIFPVRDLGRALAHYGRLGFTTRRYAGGGYGYATLDGVEIHLGVVAHATTPASAYLVVDDADELARTWAATGADVRAPEDTPWGRHEGAMVDPDGNVIRFGSPARDPSG